MRRTCHEKAICGSCFIIHMDDPQDVRVGNDPAFGEANFTVQVSNLGHGWAQLRVSYKVRDLRSVARVDGPKASRTMIGRKVKRTPNPPPMNLETLSASFQPRPARYKGSFGVMPPSRKTDEKLKG